MSLLPTGENGATFFRQSSILALWSGFNLIVESNHVTCCLFFSHQLTTSRKPVAGHKIFPRFENATWISYGSDWLIVPLAAASGFNIVWSLANLRMELFNVGFSWPSVSVALAILPDVFVKSKINLEWLLLWALLFKSRLTLIPDEKLTKEFISLLSNGVQRWYLAKLYIRRSQSWRTKLNRRSFHQNVENVNPGLS